MLIGETTDFFPTVSQLPRNGHLLAGVFLSHCFPAIEESVGYMGIFKAGDLFSSLMHFYQRADMAWSMMTFGLVGIQTPFNPKKSKRVDC